MTFTSRDAFPARGGVGKEGRVDRVSHRVARAPRASGGGYVELHAHSAYSFLDGASLPEGLVALSGCARHGLATVDAKAATRIARAFDGAFYVEVQRPYERGDARRNARLEELAEMLKVPTVATGNVHAHSPARAHLQDALVAIKSRTSLDGCERERGVNHECVLLSPADMAERLPRDVVLRTREIADRCAFDL